MAPHIHAGRVDRYLEALRTELTAYAAARVDAGVDAHGVAGAPLQAASRVPSAAFETIYVGGGTPTALPVEAFASLVGELGSLLPGRAGGRLGLTAPEFTVEANPGTIDEALLERLAAAGVNRLSLGVQSFAPTLRFTLGRRVTQAEIRSALAAIKQTAWEEWNLDLVFGIPRQTWAEAAADIDAAVSAEPTHISLYDLTYTPAFRSRIEAAFGPQARLAAASFAEQHYAQAVARLEAAGYCRYEVSNFALPGHECRHNQAYWRGEDYLGIGAAAVSTLAGERRTNPRSVRDYLDGQPPQIEVLSLALRLWEKAMLGLRTSEGVDEVDILPVIDATSRDRLVSQGCLERRCGKLRLNSGFMDVSNAVISALLISPEEL